MCLLDIKFSRLSKTGFLKILKMNLDAIYGIMKRRLTLRVESANPVCQLNYQKPF